MSSNNKFGTIIQIGDILVSEDVVTEYFACDYAVCKGCCCIIGDSGAPLEESELEPLEENYPIYSKLMRPQGRAQIDKEGFFSIDRDGDIVTPVVDQTEECAYTTFDEAGNCFCSIERCFFQGECKFRKPQSCWLYPIRVTKLTGGGTSIVGEYARMPTRKAAAKASVSISSSAPPSSPSSDRISMTPSPTPPRRFLTRRSGFV